MRPGIVSSGIAAGFVWLAGSACSPPPAQAPLPKKATEAIEQAPVDLRVAGALNRMPSLAVSGQRVIASWTATADDVMHVYAAVSEDAGATFSPPVRLDDESERVSANAEQPPRVAVSDQLVTVIWPARLEGQSTIRMARSHDGGRTFGAASALHGAGLTGLRGWQAMTPGRDAVHAVWLDGRHAEPSSGGHHHHASREAGAAAPPRAAPRQDVYSAVIAADGSITEAHVARDVCFCCKTAVGVASGGRVFVAWRHIFPESMRDIALAVSGDGGRTFGPFARVSEDGWKLSGCPDDGPALAVDARDKVHIVWPTLVDGAEPRKAIFYSFTTDGTSFAPRLQMSSAAIEDAGHPQLAVDEAGNVAAAWDEHTGEKRNIVVRLSRQGSNRFEPAVILTADGSGLNPFVAGLRRGFLVAWATGGEASAIRLVNVGP